MFIESTGTTTVLAVHAFIQKERIWSKSVILAALTDTVLRKRVKGQTVRVVFILTAGTVMEMTVT